LKYPKEVVLLQRPLCC